MLGRALESGVPFAWFTGDEVYGSDSNLRLWLEREEIPYVNGRKRLGRIVGHPENLKILIQTIALRAFWALCLEKLSLPQRCGYTWNKDYVPAA